MFIILYIIYIVYYYYIILYCILLLFIRWIDRSIFIDFFGITIHILTKYYYLLYFKKYNADKYMLM